MKNLGKILVMTLLVSLFGVVAISSLVASPGDIQSPQTAIKFDAPSGIRWNQGKEGGSAFEVFNAAGFSYIASGFYINAAGEYSTNSANIIGGVQATGDKVYHIMQDIPYTQTSAINKVFTGEQAGTGDYIGPRFSILAGGVVNGRGCTLTGFPIRNGSALFESNAGTIRNLKIQSPTFIDAETSGSQIGLLAKTNTGLIEDCEIKETQNASSVAIALDVAAASIGAIAFESSGANAIIRGNINYSALTTTGTLSAGIVATTKGGEVRANTNNGAIAGDNAGGIAALSDDNTKIKDNKNNGDIAGISTACGILASGVSPTYSNTENITGNQNFTPIQNITAGPGGRTAGIFIGKYEPPAEIEIVPIEKDIVYHPDGVFLITSAKGLSYIGTDTTVNTSGDFEETGICADTTASSKYYITNDIPYVEEDFPNLISLDSGGLLDGQGYKLTGFQPKDSTVSTDGASFLIDAVASEATVKNINLDLGEDEINVSGKNVGILAYNNKGTIANCTTVGNVKTRGFGGIAYIMDEDFAIIRDSTARVSVYYETLSGEQADVFVGGLVGDLQMTGVIIGCSVKGVTLDRGYTGVSYCGGIAGQVRLHTAGLSFRVQSAYGSLEVELASILHTEFEGIIANSDGAPEDVYFGGAVGKVLLSLADGKSYLVGLTIKATMAFRGDGGSGNSITFMGVVGFCNGPVVLVNGGNVSIYLDASLDIEITVAGPEVNTVVVGQYVGFGIIGTNTARTFVLYCHPSRSASVRLDGEAVEEKYGSLPSRTGFSVVENEFSIYG